MGAIRENWRVILLTVLIVFSAVALFVPGIFGTSRDPGAPSNLQFGLELDGGSRIRAPVVGMTATVDAEGDYNRALQNRTEVTDAILEELGRDDPDLVAIRQQEDSDTRYVTVELFVQEENVSQAEFASALQAAGLNSVTESDVRDGVTADTRSQVRQAINRKISEAGFSGREVRTVQTLDGENFIVIEVPDKDPAEIKQLLASRGEVHIDVYYTNSSAPNGTTRKTVLVRDDIRSVGTVQSEQTQQGQRYYVPVTVREDAAGPFQQEMTQAGFGDGGICNYETRPEEPGECLLTVSDGEVVYSAGVQPSLGQSFRDGSFEQDPSFVINAENFSEARELQINLRAGELRAPLDFEDGTEYSLEPALAQNFKTNSAITGLIAVLAVSIVVYFRYGDGRVAAPMVVTALSEVVILLGFAAVVQLQLDLSHIAGFIAVIGTGVDDLIIIADEVLSEGDVSSSRVFQNRFRKAFWVIGAAAATTIIAMSPLAVLSLGDLQGFAIVTILGVLVGVLITRPAYGDILRQLTTN
jgi:preprotein translocase subunit SecD